MWSRKGQRPAKSPTQKRTSSPPTHGATELKGLFDLPVESFKNDQMSGDKNKNAKMCKVCLATLNHEPKCPNTQLRLEGAKSLYAK